MRKSYIAPVVILMVAGITGCTAADTSTDGSQGSVVRGLHASRAKLYDSFSAVAADSSVVIYGTVRSQETVVGDVNVTLSTVDVRRTIPAASLGTKVPRTPAGGAGTHPDVVVVRQMGSSDYSELPAPLLQVGEDYLLFLTPSQLPGDEASQFYITGGDSGLLQPASGGFRRMNLNSGDSLRSKVTENEIVSGRA